MKNLIIMSLAFFALALVGCGKSKAQRDCEKKSDTHEWKADDKECVEKEAEGGEGGEKVAETEETCKAKAGKKWVAENKEGEQCVAKTQAECTGDNEEWKAAEGDKPAQCAEKVVKYSFINRIADRTLVVSSGTATKELAKDACVLVAEAQVAALKVTVKAIAADATANPAVQAQAEEVLCDGSETPANAANDCKKSSATAQITGSTTGAKYHLVLSGATAPCTDNLEAAAS